MLKPIRTLLLLSAAAAPFAASADWYFRGTPNTWGSTAMTAMGGTLYQTCQTFGSGDATGGPRFKIDRSANWVEAYPTADYVVSANTSYTISFSSDTHQITVATIASCGGEISPPTKPGTPTSTNTVYNSVVLTWTASTDNVGVIGYRVLRNGVQIGTSATNTYTDNTVAASTSYTYTVIAYDASNNNSVTSDSLAVVTPAAPPVSEWFFRGTANAWGKTQLTSLGGTSYQTCQYFAGGDATGSARFKIDRLGDWTQAYPTADFTVASPASYKINFASDTKAITVTAVTTCTVEAVPPTKPGTPTSSNTAYNSVALSWTASTDNVAVTGYKVLRNGSQIGTATTNSYTDSTVAASTAYSYTVVAYDASGNNSVSSDGLAVVTPAAPPVSEWYFRGTANA